MLHELVLTDVYARGSAWEAKSGVRPEPATYRQHAIAKPLSAEQMYHSYLVGVRSARPESTSEYRRVARAVHQGVCEPAEGAGN